MSDSINPDHYKQGSIECIEAMKIVLTPEEFRGYLKCNVFKYLWREKDKNGIEDLKKAKWYLDRLVNSLDEYEQQKASDLQSLKDHPFGKLKEPAIKQSLTTEPPDGWRWLEVGEVIRKGDRYFDGDKWKDRDWAVKETYSLMHQKTVRRNRFEVGEKVVHVNDNPSIVYTVDVIRADGAIIAYNRGVGHAFSPDKLAPYIEETKPTVEVTVEVTGEVKNPIGCPDGWRFLEVGEVICKGDVWLEDGQIHSLGLLMIGQTCQTHWKPIIRRNRFEAGEKVVDCQTGLVRTVQGTDNQYPIVFVDGVSKGIESKHLAPYIEDAT